MMKATRPADRTILVRGKEVRYKMLGAGAPLVLVHGLSGSSRWWMRNVQALSRTHEVYLIDLPGYGAMKRRGNEFSLQDGATWLRDVIVALELGPISLIGHSMGGYVALTFAASYPELLDKLVLVAPAGLEMRRTLLAYLLPLLQITWHTNPLFFPILVQDALTAGPRVLLRSAKEIVAQNIHEELESVQQPILLIWGTHDTLVPPSVGILLKDSFMNAQLVVLEGAGHVPMFDRSDAFNAAVLRFLDTA